MKKIIITGLCLAALLLAGCGEPAGEKQKETSEAPEKTVQAEAAKTTAPEKTTVPEKTTDLSYVPDGIRRLLLEQNGEEIFALSKEPADYKMDFDYWEILNPYDETATVNTEAMYQLFDMLCSFDFQTPVSAGEADTGISDSAASITLDFVKNRDSQKAKQTLYADATARILIGKEDGQGNYFAAIEGREEQIYKLPKETLDAIFGLNPFDYILKIPVLIDIETVASIEIQAEGETFEMRPDTEKGAYYLGKEKVEKETFTGLYQALSSVLLTGEAKDKKTENTQQEKQKENEGLRIRYCRNTDNAPEVTVAYFPYDEEHDLVSINGNQQFLVNAEDVETLLEQIREAFN